MSRVFLGLVQVKRTFLSYLIFLRNIITLVSCYFSAIWYEGFVSVEDAPVFFVCFCQTACRCDRTTDSLLRAFDTVEEFKLFKNSKEFKDISY